MSAVNNPGDTVDNKADETDHSDFKLAQLDVTTDSTSHITTDDTCDSVLEERLALVEKELLEYSNITNADIDNYLTSLHDYNETRDVAQVQAE